MKTDQRHDHWEQTYAKRASDQVSWFQAEPATSLRLLEDAGLSDWT
jgi:hypothetical protein